MNQLESELASWLKGEDIFAEHQSEAEDWIAGFDADRQAVLIKLGPYKRIYLRPLKFTKRFYHQLYPLTIENWAFSKQLSLFKDFCAIDIQLSIRFQATLAYVQRNSELLANINSHIKQTYSDQVGSIVNRELQGLDDGRWVQTGLYDIEKKIATNICELLALQQIQAETNCKIHVKFQDFPEVAPGPDNVYLHVLKKAFEITDQKNQETSRQQRLLEEHSIAEKQKQLEYQQHMNELALKEQALEADKNRRLLIDKQDQLVEQLAIEKRIYAEQLQHQAELNEMRIDSELKTQELQKAKQRLAESQQLSEMLIHQAQLDEQKLSAEILRQEKKLDRPQNTTEADQA